MYKSLRVYDFKVIENESSEVIKGQSLHSVNSDFRIMISMESSSEFVGNIIGQSKEVIIRYYIIFPKNIMVPVRVPDSADCTTPQGLLTLFKGPLGPPRSM